MVESSEVTLEIESLDLDANGVARSQEGKVVFVRGALPGERVRARIVRRKPRFDVAQTLEVLRESGQRVTPRCPHFGVCGGCAMQHLDPSAQLAIKQRALEDQLQHIARLRPASMLRPISGPAWGYRYRARLSVRHVPKKGGVLVGFHERGSSYVADMRSCEVLPRRVSDLLPALRDLIASLQLRDRLPQIEVALGDQGPGQGKGQSLALVFRVLDPMDQEDRQKLIEFARRHQFELWVQPGGPDSIVLWWAPDGEPDSPQSRLGYALEEFHVRISYRPTDFTQVNHRINEALVARAIRLLEPAPSDRVADLFCGLGNFSLPLARRCAEVVGIEGSAALVARAAENARLNQLDTRASFRTANLFQINPQAWAALGAFDRVLIDPPREGALEVCKAIAQDAHRPTRIVYVSCNPATLARDAAVLTHNRRFRLTAAGAINMFPHTAHVESIALFEPYDEQSAEHPEPRAGLPAKVDKSPSAASDIEGDVTIQIGQPAKAGSNR
ncbi:MAG: 23S rRNA (uracil(1939)-C(5))-methyltransferase RlmD [Quisquiliibacterium sp.]